MTLDESEPHGEEGNETLFRGAGSDGLYGGEGLDTLDGGAGDDILDGSSTPAGTFARAPRMPTRSTSQGM